MMGQPDVHRNRAVDARRVAVRLRAVDPRAQRPAGRVDGRVLLLERRRARHEVHQRLVVAVNVQRQVGDLLGRQLGMQVGLVSLNQRFLAGYLNDFAERADGQRHVDADRVTGGDVDSLFLVFTEAGQRRADVVNPGQQVTQGVSTARVGHCFGLGTGAGVRRGDRDSWNERALGIVYVSDDAAVEDLGMDGGGEQADCTKRRATQQPPHNGPANALTHGFPPDDVQNFKTVGSVRAANDLGHAAFDILPLWAREGGARG